MMHSKTCLDMAQGALANANDLSNNSYDDTKRTMLYLKAIAYTAMAEATKGKPMEKLELQPCPFCKSIRVRPTYDNGSVGWVISCTECGASGPVVEGKDAAIIQWNKRG